jgi:hypothetical protein
LIEKEVGDHGKIPSYRWRNEGILPGFAGYRISRKIEVQDPRVWEWSATFMRAYQRQTQHTPLKPH